MALAITSFLPTTGPCTGGTKVVITGTGLTAVTAVMVGDVEATIDTSATNTALSLTFITPAVPNSAAGAYKVTVLDSATPTEAQSSGSFTYTAVTLPLLTSTLATRWKIDVDSSEALDGSAYIPVRGMTDFQPSLAFTTQDDSDYESVGWGLDAKTQQKWSNVLKLSRKRASGYVEDPGQKVLRDAHDQFGSDSVVRVRWYDRNGGDEAYEGYAMVEWSEDGGNAAALSAVSVTLMGQGARSLIENPAA